MIEQTPLCKLAFKYGSDKCLEIKHPYTPFYYNLFKDKTVRKMVEVGIGHPNTMVHSKDYQVGASLRMWRDFFPQATIYGIDNNLKTMFSDHRIKTLVADTTDSDDLDNIVEIIGGDIDVFIDDGSHKEEDQVFLCKMMKPKLPKDVIYIIEDARNMEFIKRELREYNLEIPHLPGRRHNDRLVIVK